MDNNTPTPRIITTNTGKAYEQTKSLVTGAQGYRIKESRRYIDRPLGTMTRRQKLAGARILAERAANYETKKVARRNAADFKAMTGWSITSRKNFKDWFLMADFSGITDTGAGSMMVTLRYPDWVEAGDWIDKPWVTYRKHVDAFIEHVKKAFDPQVAALVHTEFEVEHNQRPHFHVWIAGQPGRSSYCAGSKFASTKLGLQGRVWHRWVEVVWGYITGQRADLITPRLTWIPRTAAERERYAQNADTPIKVMRYFVKEGKSLEMAQKRLQLRPPTGWIERKQRFTWVMPFGIGLRYVELELDSEHEDHVREIGSAEPDNNQQVLITDEGEVRTTGRFSREGKQGARQYGTVTKLKAQQLHHTRRDNQSDGHSPATRCAMQ